MTTNRFDQDEVARSTTEADAGRVAATVARATAGRRYAPPRLTVICTADLLEVLGPAQAGYGVP